MTEKEKLALLEEAMELDEGTLSIDDVLEDYPEWDSISALSLIALVDEKFGKILDGQTVKKFEKVSDVLAVME